MQLRPLARVLPACRRQYSDVVFGPDSGQLQEIIDRNLVRTTSLLRKCLPGCPAQRRIPRYDVCMSICRAKRAEELNPPFSQQEEKPLACKPTYLLQACTLVP